MKRVPIEAVEHRIPSVRVLGARNGVGQKAMPRILAVVGANFGPSTGSEMRHKTR